MKFFVRAVLVVLAALNIAFAEEENKATALDEAVVTATRTERASAEVPAGVTAVTKEDIKNIRMFGMKEALEGISGVQSETKNGGYDSRLIIRGAGLKARYGVREIMVLLDGVPITDPDGLSRFDFIDTQLVERIDVLKGPNSTLYGANAAGGVVNIITRNPFEETTGGRIGYGSENTRMYNAMYGNKFGNTSFSISGSRRSTDSWRKWNKFDSNQATVKVGTVLDEKTTVEAAVNYSEANIQLPGTLTAQQFEQDISQLTEDPFRNSGRYSHAFFSSISMKKEMGGIELKPTLYFQKWDHYHPVTGFINDGGANIFGVDVQTDIKHSLAGANALFTAGISGQLDDMDGKKYAYGDYQGSDGHSAGSIEYTLSDARGELSEIDDDTTTKVGVYIQESVRPSERWVVDLGVRYDRVNFDLNEQTFLDFSYSSYTYSSSESLFVKDMSFDAVSPRFGAVYKLADAYHVYGNVSSGFQTPQTSELATNADLKPSRTYNYETGLKGRYAGGHSFNLALFYIDVRDDIVQSIGEGNVSTYSNAGKTRKKGVEFDGRVQAAEGLFLGGTYTYSDFRFAEFMEPVRQGGSYEYTDRSGNRLPYIPMNQYSIYTMYKHPSGFKGKIDTTTWGEYFVDNANSEKYKGYGLITSVLVGYEKKNLDVAFDVSNVLDKKYAMEVTKSTSGDLQYRPGAPITWMAKVSYYF
jgi:iron complex outermembrane receptor protein